MSRNDVVARRELGQQDDVDGERDGAAEREQLAPPEADAGAGQQGKADDGDRRSPSTVGGAAARRSTDGDETSGTNTTSR